MLNRQIAKLLQVNQVDYTPSLNASSDPYLIRTIEQTNDNCLAAVNQNGMVLQFIKNRTPEICLAAVTNHGYALQFVIDQTPEIALAAINANAFAAKFVDPKINTPEFRKKVYTRNYRPIRFLGGDVADWLMAIAKDPTWFLFAPHHMTTIEFLIKAVEVNPTIIKHIKDQTPDLCRLAVKLNPTTWEYCSFQPMDLIELVYDYNPDLVKKKTYNHTDDFYITICKDEPRYVTFLTQAIDIQRRAVKRNAECLMFMKDVDQTILIEAMANNPNLLRYVQNQTPELQTLAVNSDPTTIRYCINPSLELCRLAFKLNPHGIHLIPELTIERHLFPSAPVLDEVLTPVLDQVSTQEITDDLSNRIDRSLHAKIPDTNTLNSLSMEIIQSNRSVDDKAALLKKLFQY